MIKFASMPLKYAPKRKTVNFSLPKWRNKLGEIYDVDVEGFINSAVARTGLTALKGQAERLLALEAPKPIDVPKTKGD